MKKTFNSIFALALCLVLLIGSTTISCNGFAEDLQEFSISASGTCGDKLTWVLDNDGTLTISGTGTMENDPDSSSGPWCIYKDFIKNIVIENGVKNISDYAFYRCSKISTVSISDSVEEIGNSAFSETSLSSITIPDSVTRIGQEAFRLCNLTSVKIPGSVKCIEANTFWCCSKLKDITISNGVESIGFAAFMLCSNLASVAIPESVNHIGTGAFSHCSGILKISVDEKNETFDSRNNCNAIIETGENRLVVGCENTVIPDSTTTIGSYAFSGRSGLKTIIIPNSVETLEYSAFMTCENLEEITIPDNVKSIGFHAFASCEKLTSIIIPKNLSSIKEGTFSYCSSLTNVTISDNVSTIEKDAFKNTPLKDVHYLGVKNDFYKITIEEGNGPLIYATIHAYVYDEKIAPTCTENGLSEGIHCSACDEVFVTQNIIPATGHKDADSNGHCDICDAILNPCINAVLNVASEKSVDYKTKVTITATATGVPEGYYLAIYVGNRQVANGNNTEVTYSLGSITNDFYYTVKVVNENGIVQKGSSGNELSKDGKIICNNNLFKKIIAFFKSIFGLLAIVTIKP